LDPYFLWAILSRGKGLGRPIQKDRPFQFAAELDCDATQKEREALFDLGFVLDAKTKAPRFTTARLGHGDVLAALTHKRVRRMELALPLADTEVSVSPRGVPPGKHKHALTGLVVAVIDEGCAFANQAFRFRDPVSGDWRSRIAYFWDQGRENMPRPEEPWRKVKDFGENFGYGYDMGLDEAPLHKPGSAGNPQVFNSVDLLLKDCTIGGAVDEAACYRLAGVADAYASNAGHGTHVADVAAGSPNPLAYLGIGSSSDTVGQRGQLIVVCLPPQVVRDTSGASMSMFVLDALRYILNRVQDDPRATQLVVNLSYGALAGPHDGSTILERAVDDLLQTRKNTTVVLPAGNGYRSRCHAQVQLSDEHPEGTLRLNVRADDPTETFVELWWPREGKVAVEVAVKPSAGLRSDWMSAPGWLLLTPEGWQPIGKIPVDEPVAAVLWLDAVVQTDTADRMVLLALGPSTTPPDFRPPAPHGVWEVSLRLAQGAPAGARVQVDAWVERDDASMGTIRSRSQSSFLGDGETSESQNGELEHSPVTRRGTLNSFAHGREPIVVGGGRLRPDELVDYSASGPGRNAIRPGGPDLVAPCEESDAVRGLLAAGHRSGLPVRMNGTSVAAPLIARTVANMLGARAEGGEAPVDSEELKNLLAGCLDAYLPDRPKDDQLLLRRGRGRLRRP
jgi:hypothetical protein